MNCAKMKVQCLRCREIVVMETFSTTDEGLRFLCSDCGQTTFLANPGNLTSEGLKAPLTRDEPAETLALELGPLAAELPTDDLPAVDPPTFDPTAVDLPAADPPADELPGDQVREEVQCPKCGHTQADRDACHRCGLVYARFNPENLPPDPEEAAAIWEHVARHPEDLSMHERFIEACHEADRLDFATRQYNILSRRSGTSEVIERARLMIQSRIKTQIAPFDFLEPASTVPSGGGRKKLAWAVVILAVLAWFTFLGVNTLNIL